MEEILENSERAPYPVYKLQLQLFYVHLIFGLLLTTLK